MYLSKRLNRMSPADLAANERYIRSERTDLFTRDRVMSHIASGVCSADTYTATEGFETRVAPNGSTYEVRVYSNVMRM